ncbi:MAG: UbiA prenyltransferase [Gammaproteobacteria bacterium]|jgi:4-hydroxybenzoate polyprenyltransferase|nr:UbiA prenyltransferase [Gammaproteobacteria bacterium]
MNLPLCIKLDNVLIRSSFYWESFILLIKDKPLYLFLLPIWCLKGRAYLMDKMASLVHPELELLPYNQALIAWLKENQHEREVILVGHASQSELDKIAEYCGCFSKAYAVEGSIPQFLNQQFKEQQYEYIDEKSNGFKALENKKAGLKTWLKAIRVHQYAKNLLIFLPLLLGHFVSQIELDIQVFLGFICFCLLASSVYILNDLLDLASDRRHKTKHKRAFASGAISIPAGLLIMLLFLTLAVSLALSLPQAFQICLLVYYVLTFLYSFVLKRMVLLDVFTLSALYTLRIVAGLSLVDQIFSSWLLLFSMFFFTSLAFAKRYTELFNSLKSGVNKPHGRGYHVEHLQMVSQFGVASGYVSTLIFVLYLDSAKAAQYYHQPKLLYLACPIILYWISRIWIKASEGQLHEDPVVYALHDKVSYLLLMIMVILIGLAIL